MTDLPNQVNINDNNSAGSVLNKQQPVVASVGNKEAEGAVISATELPLKPIGHEVILTKEVSQAGVSVAPQTVAIPPAVSSLGVKSVGANVPPNPTNGSSIKLPLTDDQISKALRASVNESVRWLAEWCVRKIKKMHLAVNANHHH